MGFIAMTTELKHEMSANACTHSMPGFILYSIHFTFCHIFPCQTDWGYIENDDTTACLLLANCIVGFIILLKLTDGGMWKYSNRAGHKTKYNVW